MQMGEQEKFSHLSQKLLHLANEARRLVEPFFSDEPVIKGTVYELKRRCGKPACKCARGELHAQMVLSASEGGKTRLQVIPAKELSRVKEKVWRYQALRHARTRLRVLHEKMLEVMDEMEAMRREGFGT